MLDLLRRCADWTSGGAPFAVATIVAASGSTPRPAGTSMALGPGGEVRGSLSGGCVEGDVLATCQEVLATGEPQRRRYGYSDADAWEAGLTCGGELDVLIHLVDGASRGPGPASDAAASALVLRLDRPELRADLPPSQAGDPSAWAAALARLFAGPRTDPGPPHALVDTVRLARRVASLAAEGHTGIVHLSSVPDGAPELFLATATAPPRLLVFGSNDFAAALVEQGRLLGYDTTVCDPRAALATPARFPGADRVVVAWPHEYLRAENAAGRLDARSAVCVLGHDPKVDDPLIARALELPVGYVGAMGSRRTHRERDARLSAGGVARSALRRLRSPIGLDLGATTPAEVAVSIMSEVIAERRGRAAVAPLSAPRLSAAGEPIHRPTAERSERSIA